MMHILGGFVVILSAYPALSLLVKGTVVVALALTSAWLARRSRAAVRHALLASAFSVLLTLPVGSFLARPIPISVPVSAANGNVPSLFDVIPVSSSGTSTAAGSLAAHAESASPLPPLSTMLLYGWFIGVAIFAILTIRGMLQVRFLRRFALPWRRGQAIAEQLAPGMRRQVEVLLHETLTGPLTCGVLRPAIILPADAEGWNRQDLERALIHELEHVRRHDWMFHCLARIACSAYWFHPLVWAAWRQLALEAERACDDAVLRRSEPIAYADQLLGLARRLPGAGKFPALAMANRSDLSARVGALLDRRQARGRAGIVLVAGACVGAAMIVLAVSPLRMVAAPQANPSAASSNIPKWDAVSIKNCANAPVAQVEGRGAGNATSPDRLTLNCWNMNTLITVAYVLSGRSSPPAYGVNIEHLPSWADSERYTIEAKAEGEPGNAIMRGPMLRALLEDRFALKLHPETRDGRAYILTVAKSGLKMPPFQGGCTPVDLVHPKPASPDQNRCLATQQSKGVNRTFEIAGLDLDSFAQYMANFGGLDGPVRNETGVSGFFHVHLEYSLDLKPGDPGYAAMDDPPFASIVTALEQQLGLTLKAGKAPHQFLVVDHLEKPTEN